MGEDNKTILQRIRENKLVRKGLVAGAFFGATYGLTKAYNAYEENKQEQTISDRFQCLVDDWKNENINADTFLIDTEQKHCAAVYKISPQLQAELASELQSYEQTKNNIRTTLSETSNAANKDLYSAVNRADLVDMKKALINGANVNMWQDKQPILDIALDKVYHTGDEHYYKSALMLVRAGAHTSEDGLYKVEHLDNQEWRQNLNREIGKHYQPKSYSARSSQTIALQQALDSLSLSLPRDQEHILKDLAKNGVLMNSFKKIPSTYHEYMAKSDISVRRMKEFHMSLYVTSEGKRGAWAKNDILSLPLKQCIPLNLGGHREAKSTKEQVEDYIQQMQTQKKAAQSILSTISKENLIAPLQKVEIKQLDENTEFKNRSYQKNQESERTSSLGVIK